MFSPSGPVELVFWVDLRAAEVCAISCPSSSPSPQNCHRLKGLGEPSSPSRKRTGHVMLKPATNTLLKKVKQEQSNKPRRSSENQWIRPEASSFRPASFDTFNQPCRYQTNSSPMNESENAD